MRFVRTFFFSLFAATLCASAIQAQGGSGDSSSTKPPRIDKIGGKNIDQWIKDLKDSDPYVRVNAAQAVAGFPTKDAQRALPALIERLSQDTDTSMRVNACIAIGDITVDDANLAKAIEILTRRLGEDTQSIVRFHTVVCLSRMGSDARTAIPKLINATKDPASWEIRRAAVIALQRAGRDPQGGGGAPDMRAVNAIMACLNTDASAGVRKAAAYGLGAIGRPALAADQTAVEAALRRRFIDKDKTVAIGAYVSILAIENDTSEGHLIALAKFLKSTHEVNVRVEACQGLGTMKERAKSRVPDLADLVDDKEPMVATAAIYALANFGKAALPALPALIKGLDNKDLDIVAACIFTINSIGETAYKAKDALEAIVKNEKKDEGIRDMARQAIKTIDGKAKK